MAPCQCSPPHASYASNSQRCCVRCPLPMRSTGSTASCSRASDSWRRGSSRAGHLASRRAGCSGALRRRVRRNGARRPGAEPHPVTWLCEAFDGDRSGSAARRLGGPCRALWTGVGQLLVSTTVGSGSGPSGHERLVRGHGTREKLPAAGCCRGNRRPVPRISSRKATVTMLQASPTKFLALLNQAVGDSVGCLGRR